MKRHRTKYPGVFYIEGKSAGSTKKERIYYIMYRKNGRKIEERVGRQRQDRMTPAKARKIRIACIEDKRPLRKRITRGKRSKSQSEGTSGAEAFGKKNTYHSRIEEKWILFMESATEGFALYDKDLNIVELNQAALKLSPPGTKKEDLIGKNLLEISPDSMRRGDYERCMRVIDAGQPFAIEDEVYFTKLGEERHLNIKAFKVSDGMGVIMTDITERIKAESALKKREAELEIQSRDLEQINTALKVLLRKRDQDKSELEEKVLFSVKELIIPYLKEIRKSGPYPRHRMLLGIIESNLNEIISPFSERISAKISKFTPTEVTVANLVKRGKSTKEIAELLNLSPKTVDSHREHIRKKLGINNQKINLRTHLLST